MIIGISGKIGSGKDTVGKIIQILCYLEKIDIKFSMAAFNYNLEKNFSGNVFYGDWHIKKFATKLKQMVCLLTGCTMEDLESNEFKNAILSAQWEYCVAGSHEVVTVEEGKKACPGSFKLYIRNYTYRQVLQFIGTNLLREQFHPNVWINALFADYKPTYNTKHPITVDTAPNWIITDMRFPNELEAVKERKELTIRLRRTQWIKSGTEATHEHPSETALDNAEFDHVIDNDGSIEDLVIQVRNILVLHKIVKG